MLKRVERLILPAFDVAYDMQSVDGNINLNKIVRTYGTMWSTDVCVNASTGDLYTEKGTSYTLIMVPLQDYMLQKNVEMYTNLSKLNHNECISLPLNLNFSFMISCTFISHHQAGNTSKDKENNQFVNLSSYGNQNLFNHILKSFLRNIQS